MPSRMHDWMSSSYSSLEVIDFSKIDGFDVMPLRPMSSIMPAILPPVINERLRLSYHRLCPYCSSCFQVFIPMVVKRMIDHPCQGKTKLLQKTSPRPNT